MPDITPRSLWQFNRLDPQKFHWYIGRGVMRLGGSALMAGLLGLHLVFPLDWPKFLAALLVSLLASVLLRFHLRNTTLRATSPRTAERLTWAAAILGVFGVQVINLLTKGLDGPESFLAIAPLAAQAMLTSALIGPSIGIIGLTVTMVLLGLFGVVPLEVLTVSWLAGAIAAHTVVRFKRRSDLVRALGVQAVSNALLALCSVIATGAVVTVGMRSVAWACLAAVVALSVFWFGVTLVERAYGIVSDWTLLELCSPENPLLAELNAKAPGTYSHSMGVGNLAETAAREVGANPVLCRAMAYYHDVGKSARPAYFVENQTGENLHDNMDPSLSAKVVAEHVKDGVEAARRARLPQAVIDGIEQHHGTSLISFFYHRAVTESEEARPDEQQYRYEGPKPQTIETGILHLADMVEAAARTVPSRDGLEKVVDDLFRSTMADGQLDECPLTMRDIEAIRQSFVRTLGASRHERVNYPGAEENDTNGDSTDRDHEKVTRAIEA